MHELARAQNVLAAVLKKAKGRKVGSVRVSLLEAAGHHHDPDEFVELFRAAAQGTPAASAAVTAAYVHNSYSCADCGNKEDGLHFNPIRCAKCGSPDIDVPPSFSILDVALEN